MPRVHALFEITVRILNQKPLCAVFILQKEVVGIKAGAEIRFVNKFALVPVVAVHRGVERKFIAVDLLAAAMENENSIHISGLDIAASLGKMAGTLAFEGSSVIIAYKVIGIVLRVHVVGVEMHSVIFIENNACIGSSRRIGGNNAKLLKALAAVAALIQFFTYLKRKKTA